MSRRWWFTLPLLLALLVIAITYSVYKSSVHEILDVYAHCWRSGYNELSVPWIHQQSSNWCWAASAQMIMNFHNSITGPMIWSFLGTPSQCQQVNDRFAGSLLGDCCNPTYFDPTSTNPGPGTVDCNRAGWPEFNKYHFASTLVDAQTTKNPSWKGIEWYEIINQICLGRPFAYSWKFPQSDPDGLGFANGHMYIGIGFQKTSDSDGKEVAWVIYLDPWLECPATDDPNNDPYMCRWHKYYPDFQEDITTQPPQYTHWRDYIYIYRQLPLFDRAARLLR